ncbi:LuxR family transcriptional regulator [Erythrobacter litoralis]|uniref:response regulator transcription factor n=1 Tax=Erythrobacter litoralis TaxID=39960 RepID=UPI00243568F9|nr:helix-turn-helix transcriptional regulator [Erythrobacter litoralis]MDG6078922.1 LuxR family transcriptional regulator [Erythrobacter litoralis]
MKHPFLTDRQFECLDLVRQGLTSKQAAHKLGISPRTVDQHIAAALDALQVNNRMAAVAKLKELEAEDEAGESTTPFMFTKPELEEDVSLCFSVPQNAQTDSLPKRRWDIFPPFGGRPNELSLQERNAIVLRIAMLSVMVSCFMVLAILGVSEMANTARR